MWSTSSAADGPEWLTGPTPSRRAAVWEAMGKVGAELEVGAPAALALLRSRAYGSGSSVDDVAAELLSGRLRPMDLRPPPDSVE